MRKFVVQSKKGVTSIVEVEVEIISPVEDPSVLWLKPGEYRGRIWAPKYLYIKVEKVVDGKKVSVMEPDIWFSHSFYDSQKEAEVVARTLVKMEFDFNYRKYGKVYTNVELADALQAITVENLTF